MRQVNLNLPTFLSAVGTRALLAFGVGLLVANRIPAVRRKRIATALIGIGAASTVPLAMAVRRSISAKRPSNYFPHGGVE